MREQGLEAGIEKWRRECGICEMRGYEGAMGRGWHLKRRVDRMVGGGDVAVWVGGDV